MLGNDYIVINGKGYTPSSFTYSYEPEENINKSEAGTELVSITRLDKHVFNASWKGIDSILLDEIEGYCIMPTVELSYRENTYTCRARGFSSSLLGKSYKYKRSNGLWDISISLTEI